MSLIARKDKLRLLRDTLQTVTGTTDIDISAADYTGMIDALTIVPTGDMKDVMIDLDFDKATTGVNEVATNADTLDCNLYVAVDGTNYVGVESMTQITLTGTAGSIATGKGGHRFKLGNLPSACGVKVKVKLSAERADAEIPYRITWLGSANEQPTVTVVAAA